jgi:RNA polymerase-binding transcription factor DksA
VAIVVTGLDRALAHARGDNAGSGRLALSTPGPAPSTDPMSTSAVPVAAGAEPARGRAAALAALSAERRRIERVVGELVAAAPAEHSEEEDLGEVAAASQHPADVASETFEREVELGLLEDFRAALVEVDHAVSRVGSGSYGACERCRQPIARDRLDALPATRWCVGCAEVAERDQRWASPVERRRSALLRDAEFLPRDDELDADSSVEPTSEEAAVTIRYVRAAD